MVFFLNEETETQRSWVIDPKAHTAFEISCVWLFLPYQLMPPCRKAPCYMLGSLMGLRLLVHCLTEASIWSEQLEWNTSIQKAEGVTSPRLPSSVLKWEFYMVSQMAFLMKRKYRLQLCAACSPFKGPKFPKSYTECIANEPKHVLKQM